MSSGESAILTSRDMLRRNAIARREALTETARHALTLRLCDHLAPLLAQLSPATLGFCWPYRAEPDLRAFVSHWLTDNPCRQAALPVVLDRHKPMTFRRWTPDTPVIPDRHGIPHPAEGPSLVPDVVLVPVNAFDAAGFRIGYGGGYFDRTLKHLPMVSIGVGFELGREISVSPQAHDQPMDWIVTEAGVFAPNRVAEGQPRNIR